MQAVSVLTFINKQTFIDEYEMKNIDLGWYSHEGYVFLPSKDNAIIKTVQGGTFALVIRAGSQFWKNQTLLWH